KPAARLSPRKRARFSTRTRIRFLRDLGCKGSGRPPHRPGRGHVALRHPAGFATILPDLPADLQTIPGPTTEGPFMHAPRRASLLLGLGLVSSAAGADAPLPKVAPGWKVERVAQAPEILFPTAVVAAPDGTVYLGQDPMDMPGPPTEPIDSV